MTKRRKKHVWWDRSAYRLMFRIHFSRFWSLTVYSAPLFPALQVCPFKLILLCPHSTILHPSDRILTRPLLYARPLRFIVYTKAFASPTFFYPTTFLLFISFACCLTTKTFSPSCLPTSLLAPRSIEATLGSRVGEDKAIVEDVTMERTSIERRGAVRAHSGALQRFGEISQRDVGNLNC